MISEEMRRLREETFLHAGLRAIAMLEKTGNPDQLVQLFEVPGHPELATPEFTDNPDVYRPTYTLGELAEMRAEE